MNPDEILRDLSSDRERADYCREKAEGYRRKYYVGKENWLRHVQDSRRYRNVPEARLKQIAESRWSSTDEAKTIIGLEQMWHRWWTAYEVASR